MAIVQRLRLMRLWAWIRSWFAPKTRRCDQCRHWDRDEGQAELAQHPMFVTQVAPFVSPQRMMDRYDAEGNLIEHPIRLRAKEDNWNAFGACAMEDKLTHCTHVCEKWKRK